MSHTVTLRSRDSTADSWNMGFLHKPPLDDAEVCLERNSAYSTTTGISTKNLAKANSSKYKYEKVNLITIPI